PFQKRQRPLGPASPRANSTRWMLRLAGLVAGVAVEYRFTAVLVQADDLVGVFAVAHFHARRAHRHAWNRRADQVGLGTQLEDVGGGHVAFDEFSVDHAGVAGAQAMRHAELGLYRGHVGLDVIGYSKAVVFQLLDPVLA